MDEPPRREARLSRRRHRFALVGLFPGSVWLVALFVVPLAIVLAVSVGTTDVLGRPIFGWHPGNYRQVFEPYFLPVLGRSLLFAVLTTLVCLVLGYSVAYTIARFGGRYRNVLFAAILLPWFVDYLIRIYAWTVLLGNDGVINAVLRRLGMGGNPPVQFLNTNLAVVSGLVYSYLPFMVLPIYVVLEQLDPRVIEAGKDLYGGPRQTFFHVTWPISLGGVTAGCVLVGLPALGDFANAQLLGGVNSYMIGNLIKDQFKQAGSWPLGAALTTFLMVVLGFSVLVYLRYARGIASEPVV